MPQGNYIKEIRKSANLTQQELADKVCSTQETIQRLENGKRRLTYDWIRKLADALGVHPSAITEGEEPSHPRNETEEEILQTFRELSEIEQKLFTSMLRGLSDSKEDGGKK